MTSKSAVKTLPSPPSQQCYGQGREAWSRLTLTVQVTVQVQGHNKPVQRAGRKSGARRLLRYSVWLEDEKEREKKERKKKNTVTQIDRARESKRERYLERDSERDIERCRERDRDRVR